MSVKTVTLDETISALNQYLYTSGYAAEMLAIILRAGDADLANSNDVMNLMMAFQFFEAVKKGDKFTDSSGNIIDFTVYKKAGGFFGAKTAELEDKLKNIFEKFDKIEFPEHSYGSDQKLLDENEKPVTLYDLFTSPSKEYRLVFWRSDFASWPKSWGSGPFDNLPKVEGMTYSHLGPTCSGRSWDGTADGYTMAMKSKIGTTDSQALKASMDDLAAFFKKPS
ncbi:MAG: hypothetical protein ABSA17_05400 [Rhabdochlamydiaceae bacterium]|jgi:hypothetical protein